MYYDSNTQSLKFSPSDLTVFWDSEFASWMDRWECERRRGNTAVVGANGLPLGLDSSVAQECKPDKKDAELELIASKGTEHEKAFLDHLLQRAHRVAVLDQGSSNLDSTLQTMRARNDFIFQARLEHDNFGGFADFLSLTSGTSSLGDYHYEAWDTKLARTPKPSFVIQLCAYSEMLEHLQRRRPAGFEVVLGTNEHTRFLTNHFIYYYRRLKQSFLDSQAQFDPRAFPHPGLSRSFGRWNTFAGQVLDSSDHLSRVANITRGQITKLESAGIASLTALANSTIDRVPKLAQPVFRKLQKQAQLQRQSQNETRPLFEVQPLDQEFPRRGLALLPPASVGDVYFDIEGFPLTEGGLEYLLGAVHVEEDQPLFVDWWAHNDAQEKQSFEQFIDFVYARWQSDPAMHIYHYAAYEVTAMRRLMGKHATREREVDDLLRHQVFVDLYTVVRQGLIVGTPSYSLKAIERLYLDAREGEVTTAGGSVVAYHEWLESGEPQNWQESPILKEIRDYNEVDCISTWQLALWLRAVQAKSEIGFIPLESQADKQQDGHANEELHPATQLAEQLVADAESTLIEDEEACRVQKLLAWLLEFHWREDKPVFWRMFDWHEKTEQELIDDFDCLGGLQRTSKPRTPIKRSYLYEYRFDPNQETKLHADSRCYFAHDLTIETTIHQLDPETGLVEIKLGPKIADAPERLCLIPNEHVSSRALAAAVFRYVEAWSQGHVPSQAIDDLIHRRPPRIKGHQSGAIVPDGSELLPATIDAIRRMDRSTLCIQGPPGTGKTYTAARAILRLLLDNKKVAVTANSHKVILNILRAVHEAMQEHGQSFPLVKHGGERDDPLIVSGKIQYTTESQQITDRLDDDPIVVGGTAWLFSRPELESAFDYLFVDEAGQFSLANVVATGLCADNIVLIGDQMQLSQPILGTHPGDSGKSALEYLLDGRATIPPDFGIFLNQTWRMHPNICGFISEAIYENRLHAHPGTSKQRLRLSGDRNRPVSMPAGIVYVPVEHEGNSQGSEEEAEAIERIIAELVGQEVSHFNGERTTNLSLDDILLVAPFNMQVRLLKQRLGSQARVGSVDKFQGQEAHVVIISMCSSTLDDSPRGAEFLLNPNRINVAVSRARTLTIVVGSPAILNSHCHSISEMKALNLFCWLVDHAAQLQSIERPDR